MKIVLTRTLNEKKGWVEGAQLDWIRPLITEMCRQLGDNTWYKIATNETAMIARRSGSSGIVPRVQKRKVEPVLVEA